MPFSDYQLDRIARFAGATDAIARDHMLRTTPGMIRPALVLAMRAKKAPEVPPKVLANMSEAFSQLLAYRARAERINRLIPVVAVVGAVCGAFVWGRIGPAMEGSTVERSSSSTSVNTGRTLPSRHSPCALQ